MAGNILPITGYRFAAGESFFVDANVWIYLYARQDPADRRIGIYSRALSEILRNGGRVYVDVLVLSEFINRYARLEHEFSIADGGPVNFKDFRNSAAFKPVAKSIAVACRAILKNAARTESCFDSMNIGTVLQDYESRPRDFNDQVLCEICRAKSFKMISHDSDLKDIGVDLLTANRKLLSFP